MFDFLGDAGPGQGETGPGPDATTDAPVADAGPPACNLNAPFQRSANQPFQNVNTPNNQVGASLSPDELTIYYDDNRKLFTATRTDISKPFENVRLLPIEGDSGCAVMGLPAITRDEKRIFFQCSNDGERTASIYTMVRGDKSQPFTGSKFVIFDLETLFKWFPRVYENQGRLELWSSVTADDAGGRSGDQFYQLISTDGGAGFGQAIPRDDLSTPGASDQFAVLTPDGLQAYFSSGPDHPSDTDIYVATRPNADANTKFQKITRVDALSDEASDDAPNWISPDGCRLYYFSGRPGGAGAYDLYLAERPK